MPEDPQALMLRIAALKDRSLTAEQLERRKLVQERAEAIQRGVPQPASGVWGRAPK